MKARDTVRVRLNGGPDRSYDIGIGISLEDAAREIRAGHCDSPIFVITDSNVEKHYARRFIRAISRPEVPAHVVIVPAGEQHKTRASKEFIENRLLTLRAQRDSVIVALGGGMIGDLAGFVASTFLRGIPYLQVPTSLLAQVDSSVGGKVAIDHPLGKNLIGAFYQPEKVYIDPATLKTLPAAELRNGMAEVIKYGAILDRRFFGFLEASVGAILRKDPRILRRVVKRCCELKRDVVQRDEHERNERRILNFGHTIGHAVELLTEYRIPHGKAVAIGMAAEARMSVKAGLLGEKEAGRLLRLIGAYGLPAAIPRPLSAEAVSGATAGDKKASRDTVRFTLLERIGSARVGVPLSPPEVYTMLAS